MFERGFARRVAVVVLPGLGLLAWLRYGWRRAWRRRPVYEPSEVPRPLAAGEPGAGGYYAAWDPDTRDAAVAHHIGVQYAGIGHQSDSALSGMWLFLATEVLFFGGLFFVYTVYRSAHPAATAEASRHAELVIGTINTVLLLTSSAVYSYGLGCARRGLDRRLFWASLITAAIGTAFLLLKGYEWMEDLDKNLFPGPGFAITGPDSAAAQLFWCFYFVATGLHGVHLVIGIGLVGWIAWTARRGRYSPEYTTPVEAVGLYWSFVDMVWLVLFPTIYLAGGLGS